MTRTTRADLGSMANAIDDALDLPRGTHYVQYAYGEPRLLKDDAEGGAEDVSPRLPAGRLMDWMRAYKSGIYLGRRTLIGQVRKAPVAAFDDYGFQRR